MIYLSTYHLVTDRRIVIEIEGIRKILLSATLNSERNINLEKLRLNNLLVYTVDLKESFMNRITALKNWYLEKLK